MAATSLNSFVASSNAPAGQPAREYAKKLVIRSQNRIFLQPVADIDFLTAAANYVHLHVSGQSFRIRSTINGIEEKLDTQKFGRIHRCTIVNFDRIQEFRPLQRGDYMVTLVDGTQLKMSRRHRGQLDKIIALACATGKHLVKYGSAAKEQVRTASFHSVSGRSSSID